MIYGLTVLTNYTALVNDANYIVPGLLMVAMAWGNFRVVRQNISYLLTPFFMLRLAAIFYLGVGSIVPLVSNDQELNLLDSFHIFSDADLLKYNIVNIVFLIILNMTIPLWNYIMRTTGRKDIRHVFTLDNANFSVRDIGVAFLAVGFLTRQVIIMPYLLGFRTGTFPAAMAQVAISEQVGIFLCLLWALRAKSRLSWAILAYATVSAVEGLLIFSKSEMLLPMIMVGSAFIYHKPNLARFAIVSVVVLTAFNFSQPIVSYGRANLVLTGGGITAPATPSERLAIVADYFRTDNHTIDEDVNYATLRLSYAGTGTFVINEYDSGFKGNNLENWYAVFIPRILWPNKPNLTVSAMELNERITGLSGSSVATGFPSEAYWNGGWWGVAIIALVVGTICWFWSVYCIQVQLQGCWHLFVIVLLGVRVGTRLDGFLVPDMLGPVMFAVFGHFMAGMLNRMLIKRDRI